MHILKRQHVMAKIFIDNQPIEFPDQWKKDKSLLAVCLNLGFDIPYFCWHPALHSVGACRQCAVKLFKNDCDNKGQIVMSCTTPVVDGMRISIEDEEAKNFRRRIIELLMINHPHDCPICDEGGECHLQDMTVLTGHVYRTYRHKKRTFKNQDIGPNINHEMNRCIQCYRCVRFYRDFAGGRDLNVFGIHDRLYFGKFSDGALENKFSGNLVEVCPTGVFTDKTLKKHYTRKWDLETTPSICMNCGIGCNTILGARSETIRRVYNRFHPHINRHFICDKGRFQYLESDTKQGTPLVKDLKFLNGKTIGIGSSYASLEANYALRRLVGKDQFFGDFSEDQASYFRLIHKTFNDSFRPASLDHIRHSDAILVLGEDVLNSAPMIALAIREALYKKAQEKAENVCIPKWDAGGIRVVAEDIKMPLYIITEHKTDLDEIACKVFHGSKDDIVKISKTLATKSKSPDIVPNIAKDIVEDILKSFSEAKRPVIISGYQMALLSLVEHAVTLASSIKIKTSPTHTLCLTSPSVNSTGLSFLTDRSLRDAVHAIENGNAENVIILNTNNEFDKFLTIAKQVIIVESDPSRASGESNSYIKIKAASYISSHGTYVNYEGRLQVAFKAIPTKADIPEAWRIFYDLMDLRDSTKPHWNSFQDVLKSLAEEEPTFKSIQAILSDLKNIDFKIPRGSHRYTGRTAITAHNDVHEQSPPEDKESPFAFSMEGTKIERKDLPQTLINRYWKPKWNSVQAYNKYDGENDEDKGVFIKWD